MESPDNTHLTAIHRRKISKPAQFLSDRKLIKLPGLDLGCGYGKDADTLGLSKIDPYIGPFNCWTYNFKTILCTYVLNTIKSEEARAEVLESIQCRLDPYGLAYITVRNDIANLNGYTKKGTWQGLILLDLPILEKNADFVIYTMRKTS